MEELAKKFPRAKPEDLAGALKHAAGDVNKAIDLMLFQACWERWRAFPGE